MLKIPSSKEKNKLERMNLAFNIIQIWYHKNEFFNFLNSKPVANIRVDGLGIPFRVEFQ